MPVVFVRVGRRHVAHHPLGRKLVVMTRLGALRAVCVYREAGRGRRRAGRGEPRGLEMMSVTHFNRRRLVVVAHLVLAAHLVVVGYFLTSGVVGFVLVVVQ